MSGHEREPLKPAETSGAELLLQLLARPMGGGGSGGLTKESVPTASATPAATIDAHWTLDGYRLDAKVIRRSGQGILLSNGEKEVWFPGQHVYRTDPPLISNWIADRRLRDLRFIFPDDIDEQKRRAEINRPRGSACYPDVE